MLPALASGTMGSWRIPAASHAAGMWDVILWGIGMALGSTMIVWIARARGQRPLPWVVSYLVCWLAGFLVEIIGWVAYARSYSDADAATAVALMWLGFAIPIGHFLVFLLAWFGYSAPARAACAARLSAQVQAERAEAEGEVAPLAPSPVTGWVVAKTYPDASFEMVLRADKAQLDAAGIRSHAKTAGITLLLVPEDRLDAALAVLGEPPAAGGD